MALTYQEQYLLELINKARLDPEWAAAHYGIDLNEGLTAGSLDGSAKQVLAPNALLETSAEEHSQWMLDTDTFSHTGENDSSSRDRMEAAGYVFVPPSSSGENIAYRSTGTDPSETTAMLHQQLFLSAGHRANLLHGRFSEIGLGLLTGGYTLDGYEYKVTMLTENFAASAASGHFLTGVANSADAEGNFGTPIEGVLFSVAGGGRASTGASGGYALGGLQDGPVTVTVQDRAGYSASLQVLLAGANAKLDLVDGAVLHSSADLELGAGATDATLLGVAGLSLTGNDDHNRLTGNRGDNRIEGAGGDDTIFGGEGDDTILGGEGHDSLYGGDGDDSIEGGSGHDRIQTGAGNDVVHGGEGNDTITDTSGNDSFYGGDGNDGLIGGSGSSHFEGGNGHDVMRAGTAGGYLSGGTGRDTLEGYAGDDTALGGDGPDIARLRGGDDLYTDTGQGGEYGRDRVEGGEGDDTIATGGGDDTLLGGTGHDELRGGEGNDLLHGGEGQDSIFGEGGDDTIVSDGDSSYFFASEMIRGGDGDDLVQITGYSGSYRRPTIIYLDNGNDRLEDISGRGELRIFAGNGNDTLSLDTSAEAFGGAGNDLIETRGWLTLTADGGDGYDTIISLSGTDDITGGNGRDLVKMGNGHDIFRDSNQGGVHGSDTVLGEDGNDTIKGGGGDDLFKGQKHNDLISGGDGHDTIDGGPGKDTIAGGRGDDLLTGGSERDQFLFRPGTGQDTITDYETGVDLLRLDRAFWNGTPPSAEQVIADHASIEDGSVVLRVGTVSVTLEGVRDTAGLAGDILFL